MTTQFTIIRKCRVIVLTTLLMFASEAYSAERIRADVVTDIDFISSGETMALQVRLDNPPDSGIVIASAGFSFQRNEMQQLREFPFLEIMNSRGCSMGRSDANMGPACETVSNDVFPVRPGESVLLVYRYLKVSDEAPPGSIINFKDITLRMYDSNDRLLPDLHLERDMVRVIAASGMQQSLPQLDTANSMAGSADLNMSLLLKYPERVDAGNSFNIEVTLINHNHEQFVVNPFLAMFAVNRAYKIHPCSPVDPCDEGRFSIGPGESKEGIKFKVEYVAPLLRLGFWDVPEPHIRVIDSLGREANLYAEPVRIIIDHPTHLPTLSPPP